MTDYTDIVNRALQCFGTRTTITSTQLANSSNNESIQANLVLYPLRDQLIRMAQWDCAFNYANLTYITSQPGTPENQTTGGVTWAKGLPAPPYAYEYQYPVDCLRACAVIPQFYSGFSSSPPITTAVTGGPSTWWQGGASRFKVGVDQFIPVTAATVVAGGSGYVVGDQITLPAGAVDADPIGAPVVLQVATLAGSAVATVTVVNQIQGEATTTPKGGSYFAVQTGTISQDTTTGVGTGATFTLTFGTKGDQRVILTNQEFAILAYCKQVTDPNVFDPLFLEAYIQILGAKLCYALSRDKALANACVASSNAIILKAREVDGNEGLTINDVTPDWIRARGVSDVGSYNANGFDWGNMFTPW